MNDERRLAFRLALELGYANPEYMLASMPYRIWLDWLLFMQYEPIGQHRSDLRAGIISSTIANCATMLANLWSKKRIRKKYKPSDFIPKFEPRVEKTPDDLFDQVQVINRLLGGEFIDERK